MQTKKTIGNRRAILAISIFLVGTGVFSFLWNIPLDKLAAPRSGEPSLAVLLRHQPSDLPQTAHPSLIPCILPILNHYGAGINNCGHIDFVSYAPAEVEIRLDHLVIGMNADKIVFNFRTKYGFCLQTSRKPGPRDRMIYEWLKNLPRAADGTQPENFH